MILLIMRYLSERFGVRFSMVLQPVEVKRMQLPKALKRNIRER